MMSNQKHRKQLQEGRKGDTEYQYQLGGPTNYE
jgi:hypothetical protein